MTEHEFHLWLRHGEGVESARRELILLYIPFVDFLAKRIARSTRANWEDLRQDGVIGLIKAIARFDPGQGVPFRAFAKWHISGAIFDSAGLTRDIARRQEPIYRKVRQTEDELTCTLQRDPTIEEVAEKAGLTVEQIRNANDARNVAFAEELPNGEDPQLSSLIVSPEPELTLLLLEALAHLDQREQEVIRLYYWEGESHEEIARELEATISNVTKIRQRAIGKLRKVLGVERKGVKIA